MNNIPAHKQTDETKKPGQIINKVQTLGDYIEVKKDQIVKEESIDPFEIWFTKKMFPHVMKEYCRIAWHEAKETK